MVNQLWLGLYKNPHPDWQAESDSNPLNCITRFPIMNKAVVKGILAHGWFFIQRIKYFGCIFWRWDCARVRFPAGMNCGLDYLKGKGLKNISKVVFAAAIYQIWLQRNRRINNSRILLEDCIVKNIRDVVRLKNFISYFLYKIFHPPYFISKQTQH